MRVATVCRFSVLFQTVVWCATACSVDAHAQESTDVEEAVVAVEGPRAAFDFEQSFRDPETYSDSKPVDLSQCRNITELTTDLWSKKHVLTDFKQARTAEQVGVIVIVKTEYCCDGSRLCAVTTACMEKKSTPLIGRFRVYAGWIKNHPEYGEEGRSQWDEDVIEEYDFIQGPGARVVVMVPTWDGKMYQWFSTATKLDLSASDFEEHEGETPTLESFLEEAVQYAPDEIRKLEANPETPDGQPDAATEGIPAAE